MTRQQAEECSIIRSVVGSTVLGLNVEGSDKDEMGICIEPIEEAMGIHSPFEQWTDPNTNSTHNDGDIVIYGLRKWVRLALKGNPTVLGLLWVPPHPANTMLHCDARGYQLRELAGCFVSRSAGRAFLGYSEAQRQRMNGERGHGRHGRPRDTYVEKYGFDTKYAMHMLRLGMQGVELLTTGRIQFPMPESERLYLLDVRQGGVSFQDCLTRAGENERQLKDLIEGESPYPDKPAYKQVEEWMLRMYMRAWGVERSIVDHMEDADRWLRAGKNG